VARALVAGYDRGPGEVTGFLVRRTAFALFLIVAVSSASLALARLAPGDYASTTMGLEAQRESVAHMRARLGLDKPLAVQYKDWLVAALHFDFGRSLQYDRPVRDLIPERAINTAILSFAAVCFAVFVGLPLGVIAGTRSGLLSAIIRAGSVVLLSMPPLLTSLFLVFAAAKTGWLPIAGMHSAAAPDGVVLDVLRHLIVPAAAIGLPLAAMLERLQAQAIDETLREPFVLATLARGVPHARIIWRDALKASLRPVASVFGLIIGTLLSGSFAVEVVTAWPGLGSLMLDALRTRDVFLVAGCAGAGAVFLAIGTIVSDLTLAYVDPRARES